MAEEELNISIFNFYSFLNVGWDTVSLSFFWTCYGKFVLGRGIITKPQFSILKFMIWST